MKRSVAAVALGTALVMSGCSESGPAQEAAPAAAEAAAEVAANRTAAAPASTSRKLAPALPAAPGAPPFAVIYPGGEPTKPVTQAQGPQGPGGILEFTTDADPETVVAFYRQRADAAGLKAINAMSQGDARGYSAGDGAEGGKLMTVIATPVEGKTSVQLDWTNGR